MSKLLDELHDLDVRNVVISGGNPLMETDRLFTLAATLRQAKPGIGITVACNGGGLDRKIGKEIKTLAIDMSFSVFGTTPDEYGVITGNPELYFQLQNALAVCRELGIKYSITVVVAPITREKPEELRKFGLSLGGNEELSFTELLPRQDNRVKPRFRGGLPFRAVGEIGSSPTGPSKIEDVGTTEFFRRRKYNFCLNGRLAIALDGSVLPCPAWPKPVTSISSGKGIGPAFRVSAPESILGYWEASKAKIPGCQSCENRYGCADCALLEWENYRDIAELRRFCDYVPELGVWQDEDTSPNIDSGRVPHTDHQDRHLDGV
jgi:radical SAM protein with 4Fe4S-binding SPASM domain